METEIYRDRDQLLNAVEATARGLDYLQVKWAEDEFDFDSPFFETSYENSEDLAPNHVEDASKHFRTSQPDKLYEEENLDQIPLEDVAELVYRELEKLKESLPYWQENSSRTGPNTDYQHLSLINDILEHGKELGFRPQTGVDRANMEWGLT